MSDIFSTITTPTTFSPVHTSPLQASMRVIIPVTSPSPQTPVYKQPAPPPRVLITPTTPKQFPNLIPDDTYNHSAQTPKSTTVPTKNNVTKPHLIPNDDGFSTHRYNLCARHVLALSVLLRRPPSFPFVQQSANNLFAHTTNSVIDTLTGNSLEYRHLSAGLDANI